MKFRLKFLKVRPFSETEAKESFSFTRIFGLLIFALFIAYLLYIPDKSVLSDLSLNLGEIVKEDVVYQKDVSVEDREATIKKREQELKNIIPVYRFQDNTDNTKNLIGDLFGLLRAERKAFLKKRNKIETIVKKIKEQFGINISKPSLTKFLESKFFNKVDPNGLIGILLEMESKGIIYSKSGLRESRNGTIKLISNDKLSKIVEISNLYDMKDVKNRLVRFLNNQELIAKQSILIAEFIMELIDINVSYMDKETKEEESTILKAVTPVFFTHRAGDIFIARNEKVNQNHLLKIEQLKSFEKKTKKELSDFYIILTLLFILFVFLDKFYTVFKSSSLNRKKLFFVTLSTLGLSALISRISLFLIPVILNNLSLNVDYSITSIYFAIPFGFSALIIAFTFNLQSAVVYSFLNAFISAIICDWNFYIAFYVLIGNLAVSFGIEYFQRLKRSPILKAGLLWLLPSNLILILLLSVNQQDVEISALMVNVVMGVFSAFISPILANFIIPLWEVIFKLITDLKLIELNNLNLPIFREMLEKAPGTYHHSQMVASLSETAASDLNIPPMLLTAMALYHDIGKIDNPSFFTENHSVYQNPHLKISPKESAKMIKAHTVDGLERADKLKLPDEVKDAITQHHGTKMIKYFLDKAREKLPVDADTIDKKDYRYLGENPQNIENGIIMLADQVEAASKSLTNPTEKEIRNVIRKIISANIEEGQFDECEGMTLKALNMIANSFYKKLASIYHTRISYPGFDFKEKKND